MPRKPFFFACSELFFHVGAYCLFRLIKRQPEVQAMGVHQDQPVITPVYELVQTVIIGLWVPELGHLVDRDPNFKRPVNLHLALLQLHFVHNIFQILKPHRSQIFPQNAFTLCLLHSRLSLKSFYELSIRAVVQKLQHLWQQRLLSF